jgi:serine beta-lactamase-like protein LACTB, mitochondrial
MALPGRKAESGSSRNLASVLIGLVVAGCASATSTQFDRAILESRTQIDRIVRDAAIPGVAIAVTVGDRIVWLDRFGSADREAHTAVADDTRFRIGSVSKVLTAAALMRLVQEGRLNLDAPVSTYLADFPHGQITLRQLAGHLGGIRHYSRSEFINRTHFDSVRASLARFANDPLVAAPGEKYAYSSYGYNVIGAVIEEVTGKAFDIALRSLLFAPLRMKDTGVAATNSSRWYTKSNDGSISVAPDVDLSDRLPAGGILSTAHDMAIFAIAMTDDRFLTPSKRLTMFSPQRTNDGKETNVGIAWRVAKDDSGRTFVHHGGEAMGARAFILVYPAERISVAFVSNLSFAPFSEKDAGEIARRFLTAN